MTPSSVRRPLPLALAVLALTLASACGDDARPIDDAGDTTGGDTTGDTTVDDTQEPGDTTVDDTQEPGDTAVDDTQEPGDTTGDTITGDTIVGDTSDTSDADVVIPGDPSVPAPPAIVVQAGSGGYLLRGTVVSGAAVHDPGEVLFVGDEIRCVAASCANDPAAAGVTIIDTKGVISAGLIDGHNHVHYNFLPEWVPGRLFDSRDVWRDDPGYKAHVAPYSDHSNDNDYFCPAGKWGELRSVIHATTTIQGQSFNRTCLDRLARNADHHHDLGYDHMGTTIASPADITTNDALDLAERFSRDDNPTTRYAVHMCEGVTGSNMAIELESYAGRDPRSLSRHQGLSLLAHEGTATNPITGELYRDDNGNPYMFSYSGVSILIHSIILTAAQIQEVYDTESYVVWSPSSNLVLYGDTADIQTMIDVGVTVGIGPDWTPSGEDDLLNEMRVAHTYGIAEGIAGLTYERIWRMATIDGAEVVGLGDAVGRLEIGYRADVAVFGRVAGDPYRAIIESGPADVRLVFIDGEAYYGDLELEAVAAVNDDCELIDACGASKFLCAANTPGSTVASARHTETVADVRAQLISILAEYDREDELNELIACE